MAIVVLKMRLALFSLMILALGLYARMPTIHAQDDTKPIKYGDLLRGELTPTNREDKYKFHGQQGDVVIIEIPLTFSEVTGVLHLGAFKLSNSEGLLIDSTQYPESSTGAIRLIKDDDYFITVLQATVGEPTSPLGAYGLRLLKPTILSEGIPIDGLFTAYYDYFVIQSDSLFALTVTAREAKGHIPDITLGTIENDAAKSGKLTPVATVQGYKIQSSVLSLAVDKENVFIVTVGSPLAFARPMNERKSAYTLLVSKITPGKSG